MLYHPQMLVLLAHVTLFVAVRCRCSAGLALARPRVGSVAASLAEGWEVAALTSPREQQSSTEGDTDEPGGQGSRSRMKLYGI